MNLRHLLFSTALAALPLLSCGQTFSGVSGIAIDADSGKVLWQKDAETPRYPASTTKIMTALLLIEHCAPDEIITAPPDIEKTKESSMHLKPGEQVTVHDMLYALMLRSANDGCVAVADHISGSVPAFAQLMNERAKLIGCTHTHFDNPNGLNDDKHTISAHDLALIAREAMKYPAFRKVVRTWKYKIHRSINQQDTWMVNRDKYLKKDPSADGIKTGYTIPAGHCFVGSATRNGFRVITVTMKSDHWQLDHKLLLDLAFKQFEQHQVVAADTPVGRGAVKNGTLASVDIAPAAAIREAVKKGDADPAFRVEPKELVAPVRKGEQAGEMIVTDADGFTRTVPLYAMRDVPAQTVVGSVVSHGGMSYGIVGGTLLVSAVMMRRKSRRMRFYGGSTHRRRIF